MGLLAIGSPAAAQSSEVTSAARLPDRIQALIAQAKLPPTFGLSIVDAATGQAVFGVRDSEPRNPASNMKLLTAAAALWNLGPDFRMQTGLYGRIQQDRTEGGVCLKGQGDPTLTRADFATFVQRLRDRGVREVDQVIVDGRYFDSAVLPPAFEQQPSETAPFRAAIGALSVNANAYTLSVSPGSKVGAPAKLSVDGSGYFEIDNQVTTQAAGGPTAEVSERDNGEKVAISVTGSVPLGGAGLALPRRVAAPLYYAGYVFIDALNLAGIRTPAKVVVGACSAEAPLLARHESQPLTEVLARLGKNSDNFVAEMLIKVIAAEHDHVPAATSSGVAVVTESLRKHGLAVNGLTMINGSGLFQGNLVAPALIAQLLRTMYQEPGVSPEFIAHLAVGGADGTLARRFNKVAPARVVRAKTGTLADVIALSGYVLGPTPGRAYAFSFLANGVKGKQAEARALIDHIVEELASDLHRATGTAH